ncbi:hypothetical protein CKA32_000610 [Geitlerinema sp. FC II]|nr:hypothetical protein CKA32_000610 [Geitlerinema sp. FC II]
MPDRYNHQVLECPKCGRLGFVPYNNDSYKCVYCNHKHSLNENGDWEMPNIAFFILLVMGALVMALS